MDDKKLILLDAYALIYRAYYALIRAPRITSKGMNTSAIFGFVNTLTELLRRENPSHIAVCFDPPHGRTFRHDQYPDYKANRQAQPEDITIAVPIIKEIVKAFNIPVFEVPGYEADDVIGTLSRLASDQGYTTLMITPDKDYGQLITDRVLQWRPANGGRDPELLGPRQVCEKFGIEEPRQMIDLLALEGDSVDNIPGCPKVGEKTAQKLIGQYGSVENLLDHRDEVPGALGRNIRDNVEQIRLSKELATICTHVPLEVDFDTLRRRPENVEALREIYTRLEFRTFLSRLTGSDTPVPAAASPAPAPQAAPSLFDFADGTAADAPAANALPADAAYTVADTPEAAGLAVEEAAKLPQVGLALYATGEEAMTATLRGIALATSRARAYYIPLPPPGEQRKALLSVLLPLLSGNTRLVSHDIKRDMVILRREGVTISAPYADTSLAHYLIQPEMRHTLSDVAFNTLHYTTLDYGDTSAARNPYADLGTDASRRLCERADITLQLIDPLEAELAANGHTALYADIELPLARVLADMEWTGVRIDTAELNRLSIALTRRLEDLEQQAYDLAGHPFNIGSPSQVGEILFGQLRLDPKAKRTKTGAYSTTEEILEKHRHDHPLVGLILEVRGLRKLLATYVNALPQMVNPVTGKIHTTYNQTVTATGRISSTNPNLQNIPIRTDDGRLIRRAFIADPGCMLLSADYSQIELRLLAALSADPDLTEAFRQGLDIHRATAAKIYHVPFNEVTDTQRRNAKTANFGTVYGISAFGLSQRLGIPRSEAKELIDGYFATYPHIRQYIDSAIEQARRQGSVTTIMGRKRYLPDINSRNTTVRAYAERNAVNAPIQGSAADVIKLAMIRIYNEMNRLGLRSKMILQVHDELVFNVADGELDTLRPLVERLMADAYSGPVHLDVASGTGPNWLAAH